MSERRGFTVCGLCFGEHIGPCKPVATREQQHVLKKCVCGNCPVCDWGAAICVNCGRAEVELIQPCVPPAAATGPVPPVVAPLDDIIEPEPILESDLERNRPTWPVPEQAQPPTEGLSFADWWATWAGRDSNDFNSANAGWIAHRELSLRQPTGSGELRQYLSDDGTYFQGPTSVINAAIAEAERKARLDEANWWAAGDHSSDVANNPCETERCRKCARFVKLGRGQ